MFSRPSWGSNLVGLLSRGEGVWNGGNLEGRGGNYFVCIQKNIQGFCLKPSLPPFSSSIRFLLIEYVTI